MVEGVTFFALIITAAAYLLISARGGPTPAGPDPAYLSCLIHVPRIGSGRWPYGGSEVVCHADAPASDQLAPGRIPEPLLAYGRKVLRGSGAAASRRLTGAYRRGRRGSAAQPQEAAATRPPKNRISSSSSPPWRSGRSLSSPGCSSSWAGSPGSRSWRPCTSVKSTWNTYCTTPSGRGTRPRRLLAEHRRMMAEGAGQGSSRDARGSAGAERRGRRTRSSRRHRPRRKSRGIRAERDIVTARDQALMELWTKSAELAVSVAGRVLARDLGPDDHRRLLETAMTDTSLKPAGNGRRANSHAQGGAPRHERSPRRRRCPRRDRHGLRRRSTGGDLVVRRALLGAAARAGQTEAVLGELDEIVTDVLQGHPKFAAILASESLAAAEKDRILTNTFENRAAPLVLRFLRVLNRHGRLGLIAPVARAARAEWDRQQNRRPVLVRLAVALDDGSACQRFRASQPDARRHAAYPRTRSIPALIGGLIVQIGDDVYDASVRSRLQQLRNRLIEGRTHEIQSRRDQFSHSA